MSQQQILVLALAIAAAVLLIALVTVAVCFARYKKKGKNYADSVKVIDGVRYSRDSAVTVDGDVNISLKKGDFILEQGRTYTAVKDGALLPGTYTLLAAGDATKSFKIRAGGYVRDYHHGDSLVLADGDTVCAVSCNVILR